MNIPKIIRDNAPTFLSTLGVLGFISSTIMAAKATPKALEVLENHKESSYFQKAIAVAPVYSPTIGMILLSTACIVGTNHIHSYRYSALLTLYSFGQKGLQEWQDAVLKQVGKSKYEKVREQVLTPKDPMPASFVTDEERVLFYDNYSGRYFRMDSVETVRRKVNDLNDLLFVDDFISLNELYFDLGLPPVEFGNEFGWSSQDGSIKIDFDAYLKNDKPCVVMSFALKPKKGY
jgi:hypothetical protein